MANLTIVVDDRVLHLARRRALEQGTSVNALLRDYLNAFAGESEKRARGIDAILELAARSRTGSGGRRWSRDDLHER